LWEPLTARSRRYILTVRRYILVDCSVVTTAPLLSMLWEATDPAEALTERFCFDDAVSAVGWMGDALWRTWAIAVDDCDRLVISAGNLMAWITTDGRLLIAKWSVVP
jgi:homoserine kinase type II